MFDPLGLSSGDVAPCCICIFPFLLLAFIAVGIVVLALRKRGSGSPGTLGTSPAQRELDHIDYVLAELETAKDESAIDESAYESLRRRFIAKRSLLLGARPQEAATQPPAEQAGPWEAPQPSRPAEWAPGVELVAPHEPLSLARITRWLLYLGVFLLFIATIIFAVYKWESFPEVVKFAALLAITLAFYVAGWYVDRKVRIRAGGIALVAVGAIMSFFDGYIYLSTKGLLGDFLSWATVLAVLAVVYLAAALFMRYQLLVYVSTLTQAAGAVTLGSHFIFRRQLEAAYVTDVLATLVGLAILATVWLVISLLLEPDRLDLLRVPLSVSAYAGIVVATGLYPLNLLVQLISVRGMPDFLETGASMKMTVAIFVLDLAFSAVLAGFFALDYWKRRTPELLQPIFLAITFVLVSCLLYANVRGAYYPFAFALLALAWLAATWVAKRSRSTAFLSQLLHDAAYTLAVASGGLSVVIMLLQLGIGGPKLVASTATLLGVAAVSIFFFVAVFQERKSYSAYPALLFLVVFRVLALVRVDTPWKYYAPILALLALFMVIAGWLVKDRKNLGLLSRPLADLAYCLAALVAFYDLALILGAAALGHVRTSATNETIIVFVLLIAAFGTLSAYRPTRWSVYPALAALAVLCQLIFARTTLDMHYLGIATMALAAVYAGMAIATARSRLRDLSEPLAMSAYLLGVYSIGIGTVYAPTLITALVSAAAVLFALAFGLAAGHGPSGVPAHSDRVHVWCGLLSLAAALLVSLNYQHASHLQANIAYVAFYLGAFALSLVLREVQLQRVRAWSVHVFAFAALFCGAELIVQTAVALGEPAASLATAVAPPVWLFVHGSGLDILMLAYVVGGFFFLVGTQFYESEYLMYAGYVCFLLAFIVKLTQLQVDLVEWYSVPIGGYVLALGYVHEKRHPPQHTTQVSNVVGMLIILGVPTVAFMTVVETPAAQLHALITGVLALAFLAGGVLGRVKVFFFGGALFLAWDALYQSWHFLYALPKWATIGTLGLLLLVSGIYLERRREQVLDLARKTRKTLSEDWRWPDGLASPPRLCDKKSRAMHTPTPTFQGKVRDVYDLGDRLLFVASDRISAYDVILPQAIPHKGEVLTALSLYWFERTAHIVDNHFLSADAADIDDALGTLGLLTPATGHGRDWFHGRSIIVRKAEVVPIECVVRGYLAGSAWSEYREHGTVCGQLLPPGLRESARLDEPIFTPSTKATSGHDENISISQMEDAVGVELADELRSLSVAVYDFARNEAAAKGIIIADTKFEFGRIDDKTTLVDEVLTPDSSRFWPAATYQPGQVQPSFDKQFVRDWLDSAGWDHSPPPPELPADVVNKTSEKYLQAYELITGALLEV